MISYGHDYPDPLAGGHLTDAHASFRRWLGDGYDLGALDVVLATAAVEHLDGDPVWLLVLSGSGNAKTETVSALAGGGAHIHSTISSLGALLSATSSKERSKNATGGLLRAIGTRGTLVLKDFTTILSMNREARAEVLAALREVYDGRWVRNVGTDGGQTLTWEGRLAFVGAVTSAYDQAHAVIASMGDRFSLVRMDSASGRLNAGRHALRNVGDETTMRADLAAVAGAVITNANYSGTQLNTDIMERLLAAADLVTLTRTAVERDSQGRIIDAHAPEMPTRFAKQLGQIVRGALAIGIDETHAVNLALRVARDSTPPMRLAVLRDVAAHPFSRLTNVMPRVRKPKSTIDRTLQELHVLGILEQHASTGHGWPYTASGIVDVSALESIPRNVGMPTQDTKEGEHTPTDVPGNDPPPEHNEPTGEDWDYWHRMHEEAS